MTPLERIGSVKLKLGLLIVAAVARPSRAHDAVPGLRRWGSSILAGVAALVAGLGVLASGDALFASFFDVGDAVGTVAPRLFAASIGLILFAFLLGGVTSAGADDTVSDASTPHPMPTFFAILGLATAIGCYAAVQASAAVLGAEFVEDRTGLTYAEYARGGFFQLVVVAAAATAALVVARAVVRRHPAMTARLRIAASILTVGVVTTVVASVVKLIVYAHTFGLTMLRIYTVVFVCLLGLVSVLALVALLRPDRNSLAPTVIATIVVGAFAMNVANPERLVVDHNITRSASTGKLDVDYLRQLSLDAAPTVFERLDEIDAVTDPGDRDAWRSSSRPVDARAAMRRCERISLDGQMSGSARSDDSGLSLNLSRSHAYDAAEQNCA